MKVCIFASGRGSNMAALISRFRKTGAAQVVLAVTDRDCPAASKASSEGVPVVKISSKDFKNEAEYSNALISAVEEKGAEAVFLAGFLSKLPRGFVRKYEGRILNVHPSLLPAFGGKGFYGEKVHQAVIASGAKISGVTVHLVNEEYDKGPIIAQQQVFIEDGETPETLAEKINRTELYLYPQIAELFCRGLIKVENGKASILPHEKGKRMRFALLSLSDKTGALEFAKGLCGMGFTLIATGGTYNLLKSGGIDVIAVDALTSYPEILDGRVKTLNNRIFAGLLYKRNDPKHASQAAANLIPSIDIAAVNLYPFVETAAGEENWSERLIENIDIGGVSLLRAAAKNYQDCCPVCDPADYNAVLAELKEKGSLSLETSKAMAVKAFSHTAAYDSAICEKLSEKNIFAKTAKKELDLRYGENPHQKAALYSMDSLPFEKLWGKELSYNNLLDIYESMRAVCDFDRPACVIFKHVTPCGAAIGENHGQAFERAFNCDPLSAFGGIIAFNGKLPVEAAGFIEKKFVEVVAAFDFEPRALEILKSKKNLRIIKFSRDIRNLASFRSLGNQILYCGADDKIFDWPWKEVSGELSQSEKEALSFAFVCVKHVRSNAIVLSDGVQTVGIGAGQMSRVDSVFMAGHKYSQWLKNNSKPQALFMASDAFFPFEDAIEQAAAIGVSAIIQPGGSIRDEQVIAKARELGIKMVLTGIRHFKH